MRLFLILFLGTIFSCLSLSAQKPLAKPTKPMINNSANNAAKDGKLYYPTAPTPINVKNRSIRDLLYFPYGCFPNHINSEKKAQKALSSNFGSYEVINVFGIGLHRNKLFDYRYKGIPIGVCHIFWSENQHWYNFYLDTKSEADRFYKTIIEDIIKAGIPLKKDKVYGGYSNRKHPVSIFKWVYVEPVKKVEKPDNSNIDKSESVGKYAVKLGVYKREAK